MIITICGMPGSGKSTVAKILAKKLNLKHYSIGDMQREIAKQKGITINELGKLEEKSDEIDKKLEEKQKELAKTEDNFIIDSRLGYHFIPNSIKIFLYVSINEAAKRILSNKRSEEISNSIKEIEQNIENRIKSEKKRFSEYYELDFNSEKNFDLVIDTTILKVDKIVAKILKFVK